MMLLKISIGFIIGLINYHLIFRHYQTKNILYSALLYAYFFSQLNSVLHIIITQLLFCAALIDLRKFILPDYLTLSLLLLGLICSYLQLSENTPTQAFTNLLLAWLLLGLPALIYKKINGFNGLGGGDIKLFMAISVWINFIYLPIIVIIACCSGLLCFVLPTDKKRKIAFGPHLAFAGWLVITNNDLIIYITKLMIN